MFTSSAALLPRKSRYLDFARLHRLHQCAAFFVTRAKKNFRCARRYSCPVDKSTGLRFDQTVVTVSFYAQRDYPDGLNCSTRGAVLPASPPKNTSRRLPADAPAVSKVPPPSAFLLPQ